MKKAINSVGRTLYSEGHAEMKIGVFLFKREKGHFKVKNYRFLWYFQ